MLNNKMHWDHSSAIVTRQPLLRGPTTVHPWTDALLYQVTSMELDNKKTITSVILSVTK